MSIACSAELNACGGDPVLSDLTVAPGNLPPVALCQDQSVCAGPTCTAQVSVDHGQAIAKSPIEIEDE